ncbi:MAG TPA: hypothetical protein VL422_09425 [Miltoncostaea sp.]|nr:hypothetical protein [Methylomirabilota bacterium]HTI33882.1 hypothetical protein [Miltoncostaea sp.]
MSIEHQDARLQRGRSWIWAAVIVEIIGLAVDALWHGVLSPDVEPRTHAEMVRHLATVHLVLYVGVAMIFVATVSALVEQARRGGVGLALPVAVVGAAVQLGGEIWHAYSHLRFQPNPLPELAGFVGLAVVIAATLASARSARGIAMEARAHRGP